MDRYTLGFLIFVGWFVCFRMFPAKIGFGREGEKDYVENNAPNHPYSGGSSKGSKAFAANCARCHNMNLEKKSTGPALMGVSSRIPGGNWIYDWVHNSAKLIQSGDAYAVRIWEDNNKAAMDSFPNFPNETIDDIMDWIDRYGPVTYVVAD